MLSHLVFIERSLSAFDKVSSVCTLHTYINRNWKKPNLQYIPIQFFNNQLHLPLYKKVDPQCCIWSFSQGKKCVREKK